MSSAVLKEASRLAAILPKAKVVGASPTRSGKQIQVRIGFREAGKARVVCYTARWESVQKVTSDVPIDFRSLLADGFNLHSVLMKAGLSWKDANAGVGAVVDELKDMDMEERTEKLRLDVSRSLVKVWKSGAANRKRDEHEISRCRKGLLDWLEHGFKHGISEEEVQELIKLALVKSVLKD